MPGLHLFKESMNKFFGTYIRTFEQSNPRTKYATAALLVALPTTYILYSRRRKSAEEKAREAARKAIATAGPCRYLLGTSTSHTITLPDGRKLGYATYGSPTGKTIIYHHGLPGARVEAVHWDAPGKEVGCRIIAVDRPGIGWSDPSPGWTLLSFARDVEELVRQLGVEEYGVMGISGGGPHVLATAYTHTPKLKAATVVCGIMAPDFPTKGQMWHIWSGYAMGGFALARKYAPFLLTWMGKLWAYHLDLPDDERLEKLVLERHADGKGSVLGGAQGAKYETTKDQVIFKDVHIMREFLARTREMFRQGWDYYSYDGANIGSQWEFRVEDIRKDLPFDLWYGKLDNIVPPCQGEELARRLGGNATLHIGEDDTHASIGIPFEGMSKNEYLENMLKHMGTA